MTNPLPREGSLAERHPPTRPINPLSNLSPTGKLLAVVAAVVFLACGSPKPASNSAGSAGGQAAAGPGATKDAPAPVGTEVSPAKGWAITVTAPATDATPEIISANQFNKPKVPTNKLYSVPVSIRNGSDKPGMAGSELKLGALPPNGVRVDPEFSVTGYPTIGTSAQLQPGAKLDGRMVFELDPATFAQTVLLAEPLFTVDKNEDQRFLALQ